MSPLLLCVTSGLPASDPGDLWPRPKLPWDAGGESFACSLQPSFFLVRLPYPETVGAQGLASGKWE